MKTTKTFLLFLGILLSLTVGFAQNTNDEDIFGEPESTTKPYKPLAQFNSMRQYLIYNFAERSDYYHGKTIGQLLADCELSPLAGSKLMQSWLDNGPSGSLHIGLEIYFTRHYENDISPVHDQYLIITFKEKFYNPNVLPTEKQHNPIFWVIQHYNLWKDVVIDEVYYNTHQRHLKD